MSPIVSCQYKKEMELNGLNMVAEHFWTGLDEPLSTGGGGGVLQAERIKKMKIVGNQILRS